MAFGTPMRLWPVQLTDLIPDGAPREGLVSGDPRIPAFIAQMKPGLLLVTMPLACGLSI
jgi:hypothetical protein